MPDIFDELFDRVPEPENRYFPESGGALSHVLGFLDLVVGAPSRAVQGGIIAGLREESVPKQMAKSFFGFSLDTGRFGKGEIASGIELLEELGLVQDKESLGNIIGGVGVDIATDLVSFNAIGLSRNLIGKGPGILKRISSHPGLRWRTFGKDVLRTSQREARHFKEQFLLRLNPAQQEEFIGQLKALGPTTGFNEKIFSKLRVKRNLQFEADRLRQETFQKGGISRLYRATGKDVAGRGRRLERGLKKIQAQIDTSLDAFDIERAQIRLLGSPNRLQNAIINPSFEQLGHAALREEGRILAEASLDMFSKPIWFKVEDFSLSSKYLGTNRPASFFDMRFPNAPRFLRDLVPSNLPRESSELLIEMQGKFRPNIISHLLQKIIPPQFSPFDFTAVLRRVGVMPRMFKGFNDQVKHFTKAFEEVTDLAKKAGIKKSGDKMDELIAKVADGVEGFSRDMLHPDQLKFLDRVEEIQASMARTLVRDPVTGITRQLLPDNYFHRGPYLHHIREDFQQQIFRDFVSETGIPRWQVDMLGDMPKEVFAAPLKQRLANPGKYKFSILEASKAYMVAMTRKIHLEPALKEILPEIRKLNQPGSAGLFRASQSMVQMFFGNYSALDGYFDDLARVIGMQSHHLGTRLSVGITAWTYRAMLGLNPRTSLLQLHQGILNNSLHLGIFDTLKGFFRVDRGAAAAYRESHITNEWMRSMDKEFAHLFGASGFRHKAMEKVDKVLFAGLNGLDNFNRGWAFHGGFGLAKRAGLSDEQAILQGIRAANETQFIYGRLGSSPLRNNPLGRVLLQFQSFAAKQLSFLTQKFRQQPGAMFARYVAISGMLTRNIGRHVDITSELAPVTPGDVRNLVTMDRVPALLGFEALVDFGRAVLQEAATDAGLKPKYLGEAIDSKFAAENLFRTVFTTLVPTGTVFSRFAKYQPTLEAATEEEQTLPVQIGRAVGAVAGAPFGGFEEGEAVKGPLRTGGTKEEIDRYGRKIRDLTPGEAALGLLGFRTTQSRLDRENVEDIRFADAFIQRRYEKLMTDAVRAVENGRDPSPFILRASQVAQKQTFIVMQALRMRLRNRRLPLRERVLKRSQRPVREQFSP